MKYLLPGAVLLLMLATGMSLDLRELAAGWKRLTGAQWTRLLLVTFLIPPVLVLGLGVVLAIERPELGGLFLIAVAPGAPLMTRNVAKRGFDMHLAANYQVWCALLSPVAIPLLVAAAGWIYGRTIWVPPGEVLLIVAEKQFGPLLAGMALMYFAPEFSAQVRRPLNIAGNVMLLVGLIALLIKLGPEMALLGSGVLLATLVLAIGCLAATRLLLPSQPTLAVSNVNRHVGLAVLLSTAHLAQAPRALPVIVIYALAALLVISVYARWANRRPAADSDLEHA